jgi:hypothetical protein
MKKIIMTILLIVSTNALAEWVYLTSSSDSKVYFNSKPTKKRGHKVKLWTLQDYEKPQLLGEESVQTGSASLDRVLGYQENKYYKSLVKINEYDCAEETSTRIGITAYSDNMGAGENIESSNDRSSPSEIIPDTIGEAEFEFACNKK